MDDRRGPDRRLFDLWSLFYDAPLVQRLTYRPEHDAVLRELARAAPRRVLDLGCGTGQLTARLRRALPRAAVIGCDFSRGMLDHAARRAPGLLLVRGDAQRLPLRPESFDAVVSTEAFHWFPDPDAALGEIHRVLAPGGRLLVSLVNPPAEWLSRAARSVSRVVGEPLRWPTRARMRRAVEAAGFRVDAQRAIFRLPAPFLLPSVLTLATRRA
jgi:ubiquinone/menaquinone biosynthesis C-methylase UbiE